MPHRIPPTIAFMQQKASDLRRVADLQTGEVAEKLRELADEFERVARQLQNGETPSIH
jgi:hypothetical protein